MVPGKQLCYCPAAQEACWEITVPRRRYVSQMWHKIRHRRAVSAPPDSDEVGFWVSYLPLVLLSSWPFLSFLATNKLESIYTPRILLIWLTFLVLCFIGLGVLKLVFRGQPVVRLSIFIGALSAWLFSYLPTSRVLAEWGVELGRPRLVIWLVAAILLTFVVLRTRNVRELAVVAIVVALAMMAVPAVQLATYFAQPITEAGTEQIDWSVATQGTKRRPNVYWFVLDSYGRADVLSEQTGYDNRPFLEALERRGFRIGWQALSNYHSTMYSLSTTLTMDYYLPVEERLHPTMWTAKLQGFSPVVERFKGHGYRYVHAEPGMSNLKTRCGGNEDRCITGPVQGGLGLSEAEVGLLKLTPLYPVIRRTYPDLLNMDLTYIKDVVRALEKQREEPYFLFAHVLSPHTPNRYNKDCTRRQHLEWDLAYGFPDERVVDGYLTDITCLNKELLAGIDSILARDKSNPFIIIQADHGPGIDRVDGGDRNLGLFAILNVIRFPAGCGEQFDPSVSAVNTFRMVFSCIEGERLPLLPSRQFSATSEGEYVFKEVEVR